MEEIAARRDELTDPARPGPGPRLRGDHAAAPAATPRDRAAAAPGRCWTGRPPRSPPGSWPGAPSPTSRRRRASSGAARPGDRRGAGRGGAVARRHAVPPARAGAGPRHPAGPRRRPGRHRRDRRRRVRRPGRRRRLPARLRLPGRSCGRRRPGCAASSDEALRASLQACAVLATSRVFAGLAHAERAQAAALRGDAGAGRGGDGRGRPHPRARHGGALPVAGAGPRRGARRRRRPAGRDRARCGQLADRLRADGFAGHEVLALHDLVRLGQAAAPVGPTCPDGGRRTVAQRLAELAERSTGCCRRCWPGTPGPPSTAPPPTCSRSPRSFAALEPERVRRRGGRDGAAPAARRARSPRPARPGERLAELLGRCDRIRTPALRRCRSRR